MHTLIKMLGQSKFEDNGGDKIRWREEQNDGKETVNASYARHVIFLTTRSCPSLDLVA